MRILHVSSEVAPFSKTGGLGDVVGELPRAQRGLGHDVVVLTPLYRGIDRRGLTRVRPNILARDGVWLLDDPRYDRDALYGHDDDPARFAHLCGIAAAMADGFDVVHLHDWQAALTAMYLNGRRPCVQTIHNLAYRGDCDMGWADHLGIPRALRGHDGLEFHGRLALLKAGLVLADRITTVSPTYAREILSEPGGHGLSGALRWRRGALSGIINGLDPANWPLPDAPPTRDGAHVVAIARAAEQKGFDLIIESIDALVAAG
ncbi:MAG: starch synthase, partial [Bradymonadia bacterium]